MKAHLLSKTDFISYKECRKNVWVKWHRPDIYNSFEQSDFEKALGEMGNEVEELARGMYPGGYLVEKRSEGAAELTQKLIKERESIIFQAVFNTEKYLAAADVLQWDPEANAYNIIEIKMSSTEEEDDEGKVRVNRKKEEQFEYDLAFQCNVIEKTGLKLNKKLLVRLNRKYIRIGELDFTPGKLFIIEDKTEKITALQSEVASKMEGAWIYLSEEKEPVGTCDCYYRGRSSHCTTFAFCNREKNVPDYSVHDLNRIGSSPKLLKELLDEGILSMDDMSESDERLEPKPTKKGAEPGKPRKLNQVKVHKHKKPIINIEGIRGELAALSFPLYFLDYETSPKAIPPYSGYHPYQHIVFQYSLHVVRKPEDILGPNYKPEHYECLIFDGDPALRVCQSLRENIGNTGTIVSWFKVFENGRNREFGGMFTEYKEFFESVVSRTYDLMDIVENQHYVHHEFYGKSSIKKVLPALIKDLSYKKLGVKNGTEAIEAYRQITAGELTGVEAEKKTREMLEYCELDTYAMYKLWKFFVETVRNSNT